MRVHEPRDGRGNTELARDVTDHDVIVVLPPHLRAQLREPAVADERAHFARQGAADAKSASPVQKLRLSHSAPPNKTNWCLLARLEKLYSVTYFYNLAMKVGLQYYLLIT